MYDYIKGTITNIKHNSIVVDNNGIGYLIYVSNPYSFEIGKENIVSWVIDGPDAAAVLVVTAAA